MKLNEKEIEKARRGAVDPVLKKAEKDANRAAARESTLDGKVNAFAKTLKRHGIDPDKKAIRKAFKE